MRKEKYKSLYVIGTNELCRESSTASVSASLLEYRQSQGRTYHSDKFASSYFFPNDDQQLESMDMTCGSRCIHPGEVKLT